MRNLFRESLSFDERVKLIIVDPIRAFMAKHKIQGEISYRGMEMTEQEFSNVSIFAYALNGVVNCVEMDSPLKGLMKDDAAWQFPTILHRMFALTYVEYIEFTLKNIPLFGDFDKDFMWLTWIGGHKASKPPATRSEVLNHVIPDLTEAAFSSQGLLDCSGATGTRKEAIENILGVDWNQIAIKEMKLTYAMHKWLIGSQAIFKLRFNRNALIKTSAIFREQYDDIQRAIKKARMEDHGEEYWQTLFDREDQIIENWKKSINLICNL